MPLQVGNREHPKNSFPALAPRFAERLTIELLHNGHVGAAVIGTADFGVAAGCFNAIECNVGFVWRS